MPVREWRTHWLHRSERQWAGRVAPLLAANVMADPDAAWRTEKVIFTGTSVAVVTVARLGSAQRFMVKMPWTAEGVTGLRRQADVLATLQLDPRLHTLRAVMPRCVWQGEIDGRYCCIEEALPGVPASAMVLQRERRAALLRNSTRLIGDLHVRTREQTLLDDAAVEAWVDAPLRRIEASIAIRPGRDRLIDAANRLREELTIALLGRVARTAWIHGDFWPGNLLSAPSGAHVTGIVDWDCASVRQLPLHDLIHLHAFSLRLTYGDELGDIVVRALRSGIVETLGVPAGEVAGWLDGIPQRSAVLLYWLRHVLLFIDSENHHDNPRWLRANVERVLANV
jgi:aminoglycoside phosphotransferase (APT) family kinase protein